MTLYQAFLVAVVVVIWIALVLLVVDWRATRPPVPPNRSDINKRLDQLPK